MNQYRQTAQVFLLLHKRNKYTLEEFVRSETNDEKQPLQMLQGEKQAPKV